MLEKNWSKIVLLCIVIIYTIVFIKKDIYFTNYELGNTTVTGTIEKINIDGNKASIVVKSKEKILISYYFNEEEEKNLFLSYKLGDVIKVTGVNEYPSENTVFNLFNYRNYLKSQKIYFILKAEKIEKLKDNQNYLYKIKNYVIDKIKADKNKEYLSTFILGDKGYLDSEVKSNYQENGVSHLLAISGMHISLFATILSKLLSKLKKNHIIISLCLVFYAFLTGFTPSVIRATSSFIFSKTKLKPINVLLILASLFLITNPFIIYDAGFLFSFIISGYLMLFSKLTSRFNNYFVKLLITSLVAFTASIPILINNFFSINILTPIWNLIFVPLVSFIVFPLSLISLLLPLSDILSIFINIMEFLNNLCAQYNIIFSMKHMPIYILAFYYLIITFIFYKPKYSYILIIILVIHINYKLFDNQNYLTMIDVGQGDSFLLELDSHNILIDTGGIVSYNKEKWMERKSNFSIVKNKTIPYLRSRGINKLDYLILTHGDYDHLGEALILLENFKVEKVLLNSGSINSLEEKVIDYLINKKIDYQLISEEDIFIGKDKFSFINPKIIDNENEDSLVFITKIKNNTLLFMGDAGKIAEENILSKYALPPIDYLKIGHHGSKNSSSLAFISSILPKKVLISAGINNRYNHPNKEAIDILEKYNSKYFITSTSGSILINLNNNKILN